MILYQFPKQKLIYGPRQIEARIDQDTEISQQLTLWSQSGSRVVRGNLLVIPIDDSLIYVEPLYLKSESSQLPELKRVIVSYNNNISMKETLAKSLAAVFGASDALQADIEATIDSQQVDKQLGVETIDGTDALIDMQWSQLAVNARQSLSRADEMRIAGDWAGYGQALNELAVTLQRLEQLAIGQTTPSIPNDLNDNSAEVPQETAQ